MKNIITLVVVFGLMWLLPAWLFWVFGGWPCLIIFGFYVLLAHAVSWGFNEIQRGEPQ